MIAGNNHLKEVMANHNGKLKDKNKKIDNLKASISSFEWKIVKKDNGVIEKDWEILHVKAALRSSH